MVRPGSPTLKPSVAPVGSPAVDEGGTVTLTGTGRPPSTRPWLQLFIDPGLGLSDENFDLELVYDYDDRNVEDYDNLPIMDSALNDEGSSLRWFAPQGCSVEVDQHSIDDANFPGGYKLLAGLASPFAYPNLGTIQWDNGTGSPNDQISAVRFSCDNYYSAPIAVSWDLNFDGSYETNGAIGELQRCLVRRAHGRLRPHPRTARHGHDGARNRHDAVPRHGAERRSRHPDGHSDGSPWT